MDIADEILLIAKNDLFQYCMPGTSKKLSNENSTIATDTLFVVAD